jgi:SAM-dependent methyltransferase
MVDEHGVPQAGDAFGAALLAALEQGESRAVIERDDGLVDVDEIGESYFGLPETWAERCRWAVDRAGGRVLDVGAGAGRAALSLQDRGQDVVALDVSAGAIEVCERRGVCQRFLGTVDDLVSTAPQPFDTFLALGNGLGLLESRERAPEFLAALKHLGHPGSTIVGTGLDPFHTTDPAHLRYQAANRTRDRFGGQVTIRVRYRELATAWFDLLWCSLDELAQLCEPAGWTIAAVVPGTLYGVVLTAR